MSIACQSGQASPTKSAMTCHREFHSGPDDLTHLVCYSQAG